MRILVKVSILKGNIIKIKLTSVIVGDQEKALYFYTAVLGFIKKNDIPLGESRWLTVVSPDGPADIELLLEPNDNPAAQTYQLALFEQGIPLTAFAVVNLQEEYQRLQDRSVTVDGRAYPKRVQEYADAVLEGVQAWLGGKS